MYRRKVLGWLLNSPRSLGRQPPFTTPGFPVCCHITLCQISLLRVWTETKCWGCPWKIEAQDMLSASAKAECQQWVMSHHHQVNGRVGRSASSFSKARPQIKQTPLLPHERAVESSHTRSRVTCIIRSYLWVSRGTGKHRGQLESKGYGTCFVAGSVVSLHVFSPSTSGGRIIRKTKS